MNKIIPFTKVITLKERFDEIKKIALDDTLKLEDPYTIKGDLIVRGCYQTMEREEDFKYPLPVEIAIDSKYDTSNCSINIDDFYYEIINEESLRIKIDLMLDNLYYKEENVSVNELVLEDNRSDIEEKEEIELVNELLKEEDVSKIEKEIVNKQIEDKNNNFQDKMNDLMTLEEQTKEYSIYRVYTVSEGETLEYIMDKYKVSKEDLMPFNDLDNLQVGTKLIIPSIDE